MHTRISHHQNKCTRQITRLSFLGLILLRANLCTQQSVFVGGVSTQSEIEFLKFGEIKTTTQCILLTTVLTSFVFLFQPPKL